MSSTQSRNMKKYILLSLFSLLIVAGLQAQAVNTPRASMGATVSENLGMTNIAIDYHRPAVNGRDLWGNVVPYNDENTPMPWRAGANDNTTVTVSHDVQIDGKTLPAGTYGLHVWVTAEEWTFIFSKTHTAWGSFNYDSSDDALRVDAPVKDVEPQERLRFQFTNHTANSVDVELAWGTKAAAFTVSSDIHGVALQEIRNQLGHLSGFSWQGWNSAAAYCLQNDVNLEEALTWADRSIAGGFGSQRNFTTLQTKSGILAKLGKETEAASVLEEALEVATMTEMHFYGRSLIQQGKNKEAMKIFQRNRDRNPEDNFTTLVGLARGHMALGNNEEAIKYFELAAPNAPQGQTQAYLNIAKSLKEKG